MSLMTFLFQDKEEVECHYEEKNENVSAPVKVEVQLVETALRETRIDEVVPKKSDYIHTLEAQSSVDSDVLAHNVNMNIFSIFNRLCVTMYFTPAPYASCSLQATSIVQFTLSQYN